MDHGPPWSRDHGPWTMLAGWAGWAGQAGWAGLEDPHGTRLGHLGVPRVVSFGGTQGRLGGNRPPDGTRWNRVGLGETCPQGRLGVYTRVLTHEFLQFRCAQA